MKYSLKCCFILLNFFSFGTGFAQERENETEEKIKLPAIPYSLDWDQKPQAFTLSSTGIVIDSGKGTDLYSSVDGSKFVNNVPKLLFKPDSNFIFSAKVKPEFQKSYDGGAIIVYQNSENWGKLLFEQNVDGTLGIWTTVSTQKSGDDNFNGFVPEKEVFLKIAKSDKAFCFYYSIDGKKWTVLRAFPIREKGDIRIGFSAQSPLGQNCRVEFSDISYRAKKFTDFYSGE